MAGVEPQAAKRTKGMRITTPFHTVDELVEGFHRNCDEKAFFVATMTMRPVGLETAFSVDLATGEPVLRGWGVVLDAWPDEDNRFDRPGVYIGIHRLTRDSEKVFEQLMIARAVAAEKPARPHRKTRLIGAQREPIITVIKPFATPPPELVMTSTRAATEVGAPIPAKRPELAKLPELGKPAAVPDLRKPLAVPRVPELRKSPEIPKLPTVAKPPEPAKRTRAMPVIPRMPAPAAPPTERDVVVPVTAEREAIEAPITEREGDGRTQELTTPERPFARREPAPVSEVTPLPPPPVVEAEPRATQQEPSVIVAIASVAAIEPVPEPPAPPPPIAHTPRAKRPWGMIAAGFVAGALLGLGVGVALRGGDTAGAPLVMRVPVAVPAPAPVARPPAPAEPPTAPTEAPPPPKPAIAATTPRPVAKPHPPARVVAAKPIAKVPPPHSRPTTLKPHAKCTDLSCL